MFSSTNAAHASEVMRTLLVSGFCQTDAGASTGHASGTSTDGAGTDAMGTDDDGTAEFYPDMLDALLQLPWRRVELRCAYCMRAWHGKTEVCVGCGRNVQLRTQRVLG